MFTISELIEAAGAEPVRVAGNTEVRGISTDSRTIKPGEAFIAIKGENFDGHNFIGSVIKKGTRCIIGERGRFPRGLFPRVSFLEVENTVTAYGDIARFHRGRFTVPVIAVTGSNGKTTTKEMIAWVLSGRFNVLKNPGTKNNHIGLPATLLDLKKNHDIIVLEIGTSHFGEVEYLARICRPHIGVITNIGPSHLEYFRTLRGVYREKYGLIKNLVSPYTALLNADDVFLKESVFRNSPPPYWKGGGASVRDTRPYEEGRCASVRDTRPFVIGFGIGPGADFHASHITSAAGSIGFLMNQKHRFLLRTPGRHNIYNALPAAAAGVLFGIEYEDITRRLSSFRFPDGRFNCRRVSGIRFIDDTYNSNPFSLHRALGSLREMTGKGRKIVVMGDMLELGRLEKKFHRDAGRYAAQVCDFLITVGSISRCAAEAARKYGLDQRNIFICDSTDEARDILFKTIPVTKDDTVLVKGSRRMKLERIFDNLK